ncbi:MAG: Glu-tRNA(Gln) amidotransferase subunit GatD [archaeon]
MPKDQFSLHDTVRVTTKDAVYQGLVLPSGDATLVLKLDNGYNIGIDRKRIKEVEVLKKAAATKDPTAAVIKDNPSLPTIHLLHTGGTIASKVDYATGGVTAYFTPQDIFSMFPEIRGIANLRSELIGNIMSENMRFYHYNLLADRAVKAVKDGADGIIITHGTDFLHYTSAALSFALKGLGVPVILVGAQRSSDRPSSDAFLNLVSAASFIAGSDYAGVGVCMHAETDDDSCIVVPGTKVRKMHTSRRDAFRPINCRPIARVSHAQEVEMLSEGYPKKMAMPKGFTAIRFKEGLKVGILKGHPSMHAEEVLAYKDFDGLVLEITGIGQMPIIAMDEHSKENSRIHDAIKTLAKKMPVAAAPQTIYGRVVMNVYSEGRELRSLGVVGDYSDMTPETAFIKLAFLLSNHSADETRRLFSEDIVGEISPRTEEGEYLS